MAKILVSPVGVGPLDKNIAKRDYKKALYKFSSEEEGYYTSFVASAIAQHLKIDTIFFIGTGKSMWENIYYYFCDNGPEQLNEDYWIELGERVSNSTSEQKSLDENFLHETNRAIDKYLKKNYNDACGGSKCFVIDYGLEDKELWSNFNIFMEIANCLDDGDEIYLDITHSFRSIPLFMYLMFDFIKNLQNKKINLAGLYYGMLDIVAEKGYAPVVDLSPLFKISQWVKGTYDFINYGNGYIISDLLDNNKISDKINNISDLVNINFIKELRDQVNSLKYHLEDTNFTNTKVFQYLRPYIEEFINRFQGFDSNSKFQFELARWYFDNKRYANGYICLLESMITRTGEIYKEYGLSINENNINVRSRLKIILYELEYEEDKFFQQIYKIFKNINDIRRVIAHAGFLGEVSFANDIERASIKCNKVENLFFKSDYLKHLPDKKAYK